MSVDRTSIVQNFRDRIAAGKRNKLSKQEFEFLIEDCIHRLKKAKSSQAIHKICRSEIALLEEGYQKLTLASIYIPRYRAAIKEAIATQQLKLNAKTSHEYEYQQRVTGKREKRSEHWALTYFKYTPEEYEQLDQRQAKVNQKRLSSLKTVRLDQYLEAIDQLLCSQERFAARHQAIAIAALTGRRMGEVVNRGNFQLTDHPYQLYFTGQQKYERDGYDILTLIPAADLLKKIKAFRAHAEIQEFWDLNAEELKVQLNKFDVQVNTECNKKLNLTGIVPPLEGKKSVTIHNLRSLWGAIACHFFCPEEQHEYAFLQHYLGHVLKSSATGHYFRYQLTDRHGQIIKAKGVKLSDISNLDQCDPATVAQEQQLDFQTLTATLSDPELPVLSDSMAQAWQQKWEQLDQRLGSVERSLAELQPAYQDNRVTALAQENQTLKARNQTLTQQLHQAQSKLEQFRQLLLADSAPSDQATVKDPNRNAEKPPRPRRKAIASTGAKKLGRKPGQAIKRAQEIFEHVQQWNYRNPDHTFAINPGFLESLFRINRKAAQQFCQEFRADISAHHTDIGIQNIKTHNRGKDTQDMITFIAQRQG